MRRAPPLPTPEPQDYAWHPRGLTDGNTVDLLIDGDQAFPAMLRAIAAAQHFVHLETYILRDDTVGGLFRDALCERARAGVEVRLMFDAFGAITLSDSYVNTLHDNRVVLLEYRPLGWRTWGRWSRRDHRKILVVDGEVAFTGGLNIADDYAPGDVGGAGWRDTHARITGPVVKQLETMFHTIWHREGGAPYQAKPIETAESDGTVEAIAVGSNHRGKRTAIRRWYLHAIRAARSSVYIANAYFVPDRGLVRGLIAAAKRGVDVHVITSAQSDVKMVQFASESMYGRLMAGGVHIHLWPKTNMHAKTAVVDRIWSTVGSYNLDYVSLFQNLEVIVAAVDSDLGARAQEMHVKDIERCATLSLSEWRQRPWWRKLVSWLCFKFRRWL